MKKLTYIIITVFLLLNLTSCSKDDSNPSDNKLNIDLLTSKSWVAQSKVLNPVITYNGMVISDITVIESEEVRKYAFKFNDDGTFFLYNHLNALILETTWTMSSDETQITFTDPVIYTYPVVGEIGLSTLTVQSISSSKFIATIPALYEGTNYELTITFI